VLGGPKKKKKDRFGSEKRGVLYREKRMECQRTQKMSKSPHGQRWKKKGGKGLQGGRERKEDRGPGTISRKKKQKQLPLRKTGITGWGGGMEKRWAGEY